ncbi:VWA domain-containing protein [Pseudenhygromyxa sp. WMMC2535]|uniref:vWA domain-containing protein n=1 Tax=Pseudenhygromyxa sp. WMMC2535 TaxID=2712867 RepID=UPI0015534E1A|nr:VWA domain-containing protein [Pseudenhygromyxa sp. WMMC2535]NVB38029.1 VWA domain-containing protein [Pseudenhygromyxa sp. WMMC2535]
MRRSPLSLKTLALATLPLAFATTACGEDSAGYEDLAGDDEAADESGYGDDLGETGGDEGDAEESEESEEEETETETDTGDPVCDDQNDVVLYLSPDDSNSMSSPVQVRERVLADGQNSLYGIPIRPWEFMNYYDFEYPAAEDGTLALHTALRAVEVEDGEEARYQLQIAVSSEEMTPEERPPMNVTLVLDTSGSMSGEPIELLRESCRAIAASLRAGDKVSVVEWDTENTWKLAGYEVEGPNDETLLDVIASTEAGGGTNLYGGLSSGYELAQMVFDVDALNRLVLISDGGANAGITDIELIAQNAEYGGSDGIYLVGAGVDLSGSYNDTLMDDVTDAGKGASVFITDDAEAWKVFNTDFVNTMGLAARNVQVELTMPPGFEIVKFSGEEFSADPKEVEPQHLAPNDAMVFYQQVETCAPELVDADAAIDVRVTWEDIETFETMEVSSSYTFGQLLDGDATLLLKGAAILAYTDALKLIKAGGVASADPTIDAAFDAIAAAQAALPGDADLEEMDTILSALTL